MPRRLYGLLDFDTAPGGSGTLDPDPWAAGIRVQELPGSVDYGGGRKSLNDGGRAPTRLRDPAQPMPAMLEARDEGPGFVPYTGERIGGFGAKAFRTPLSGRGVEMARQAEAMSGYQRGGQRPGVLDPALRASTSTPPGMLGGAPRGPRSRLGALAQMLTTAAAGVGQTPGGGNWLGGALGGASLGLAQYGQMERERQRELLQEEFLMRRMGLQEAQLDIARQKLERGGDIEPKVLPAGGQLVDAAGRVLANNPREMAEKLPTTPAAAILAATPPEKRAQVAQWLMEEERAASIARAQAGRPQVNVTPGNIAFSPKVMMEGETAFAKSMGDLAGKQAAKATEEMEAAAAAKSTYDTLEGMAASTPTGPGEWAKDYLRSAGEVLGIKSPDLSARQAYGAVSNKLVLSELGGLGTAISNTDRDFIKSSQPNTDLTPEANAALINIGRRVQDRKMAVAEFKADWIGRNGSLLQREGGKTFQQALADQFQKESIITPEDKAAIQSASAAAGGTYPEPTAGQSSREYASQLIRQHGLSEEEAVKITRQKYGFD